MLRSVAVVALVAVLGASPPPSPTPPSTPSGGESVLTSNGNYTIETDTTNWNQKSGDFTMPHKVKFTRPGTDATADKAQGNTTNGTATLIGNVVVNDSGSAPEASSEKAYSGNGPAKLTCDRLEVDSKKKRYTCTGNVHFAQKDETGEAQHAVLDRGAGTLLLEGDVKLSQGGSSMTGQNLTYNLNSKDVTVQGSPVIIKEPVPTPSPGAAGPPAPKKRGLHLP